MRRLEQLNRLLKEAGKTPVGALPKGRIPPQETRMIPSMLIMKWWMIRAQAGPRISRGPV